MCARARINTDDTKHNNVMCNLLKRMAETEAALRAQIATANEETAARLPA